MAEQPPQPLAPESVGVARSTGAPSHTLHLERPAAGLTTQGVQVVSGRVSGPSIRNVSLSLNGVQHLLDVWGDRFQGEIALSPGDNQIWAVAMGASGPLAEETVRIEYAPPPPSGEIRIIRPVPNESLDPTGPAVLLVEGTVPPGPGTTVAVLCNDLSIPATVKDGRFQAMAPAFQPSVTIRAEGRDAAGSLRSEPVTISIKQPRRATGFLVLYLPTESPASQVRVWLSRREDPSDVNTQAPFTFLKPPPRVPSERGVYVLPFPQADSGAVTLVLRYRLAPGDQVQDGWAALYVAGRERYRVLRLGPIRLQGEGQATLAQFLLPQQVFWEEDHWFTGSAQGAETVTKFRYADRISWVERKAPPDIPSLP